MDKEEFLSSGLLELYILGLASKEETAEVEYYLKKYPELRSNVNKGKKAIDNYADQYLKKTNPSDVKDDSQELSSFLSRIPSLVNKNILLLTLTIGSLFGAIYLNQRTSLNKARTSNEILSKKLEECQNDSKQLEHHEAIIAFFQHQGTRTLHLNGTTYSPVAEAIVYWNDHLKVAYCHAFSLPKISRHHQYQVWADVNGEMVDMGLLEKNNNTLHQVQFIGGAESFNITVEPLGGSKHPTVERLAANGVIANL